MLPGVVLYVFVILCVGLMGGEHHGYIGYSMDTIDSRSFEEFNNFELFCADHMLLRATPENRRLLVW